MFTKICQNWQFWGCPKNGQLGGRNFCSLRIFCGFFEIQKSQNEVSVTWVLKGCRFGGCRVEQRRRGRCTHCAIRKARAKSAQIAQMRVMLESHFHLRRKRKVDTYSCQCYQMRRTWSSAQKEATEVWWWVDDGVVQLTDALPLYKIYGSVWQTM